MCRLIGGDDPPYGQTSVGSLPRGQWRVCRGPLPLRTWQCRGVRFQGSDCAVGTCCPLVLLRMPVGLPDALSRAQNLLSGAPRCTGNQLQYMPMRPRGGTPRFPLNRGRAFCGAPGGVGHRGSQHLLQAAVNMRYVPGLRLPLSLRCSISPTARKGSGRRWSLVNMGLWLRGLATGEAGSMADAVGMFGIVLRPDS